MTQPELPFPAPALSLTAVGSRRAVTFDAIGSGIPPRGLGLTLVDSRGFVTYRADSLKPAAKVPDLLRRLGLR